MTRPGTASDNPTLLDAVGAGAASGYTVLARRYRSRDFDEIVGQEAIARTLRNAIAHDRTAHAYLFCGTRGVGKTSMARIFAKALNAAEDLEQRDEIAEAILRGDDLDVIEIDGASNRGIQDARELIAGAGLSPSRCPYKIYIIDEVHALTKDAFNALLKTMEEPPAHVKFVLCTTEPQKVPATIQSRCQRFDFRPIPTAKIAAQLRWILEREGIEADDEVIARVATLGNGSMRDALSLLDRLIAAGEPRLTGALLEDLLGVPDQALIFALVDAIATGDAPAGLRAAQDVLDRGTSIEQTLELLAEHFRVLLVIAACGGESELIELSAERLAVAVQQAQHFDAAGLVHLIALCDATSRNLRFASAHRAVFDALIVRLCLSERFADIGALVEGAPAAPPAAGAKKKEEAAAGRVAERERVAAPAVETDSITEVKSVPTAPSEPISDDDLWTAVQGCEALAGADRAKLEQLEFREFDGRTLRLGIAASGAHVARFLVTQTDRVAAIVLQATGRSVRVKIEPSATTEAAGSDQDGQEVEMLPLVRKARELFDARVLDVRMEKGAEDV